MNKFEIGDIVELKSGGPAMSVCSINNYDKTKTSSTVYCAWFDNDKHHYRDCFNINTLKRKKRR